MDLLIFAETLSKLELFSTKGSRCLGARLLVVRQAVHGWRPRLSRPCQRADRGPATGHSEEVVLLRFSAHVTARFFLHHGVVALWSSLAKAAASPAAVQASERHTEHGLGRCLFELCYALSFFFLLHL